jgi:putative ABC transport system permease protein
MSAVADASALGGPRNGGVAARRALIRWASRLFRREWRQQILVLTLLTVAVATAVGSITLVHNTGYAEDAEFGSASDLVRLDGADPRKLEAGLAAARRSFGTTDVIGHRSIPVPGGVENVDFRAQDPDGPYGGALLALRRGSYPVGPRQVAITDGVANLLRLELGATLALDGRRRTVVGIVENPRDLSDEFALVSPSSAGAPEQVTVLVHASPGSMDSFMSQSPPGRSAFAGSEKRGNDDRPAEALLTFSVVTVFLLLVSLVAAAGFAVVAQRRLRQLGMLAAIGATQKHLRLVVVSNGALVGTIAAVSGTIVGLALWIVVAPTLESAIGHRVDRLSVPWGLIAMAALLAVLGATAAAWWPGRTVARLPVMLALSGRPPKPRPARHAALAAAVLIAIGIGCLALSSRDRRPLIVAGIVTTILGCLLLGPPAIRVFSGLAGRVSIASRLALRDLVRYQARSGAALAAVTLALGIAATVVVIASAEHAKKVSEPPNLSDRQIRVYTGPPELREEPAILTPAQLERRAASVRQLAGQLARASVIALPKAVQPGVPAMIAGDTRVRPTAGVATRVDGPGGRRFYRPEAQLYVGTPAVLRYLGIDPATVDPGTDFLADRSVRINQLVIPDMTDRHDVALTNVQRIETGRHLFGSAFGLSKPPMFITLGGLRRHGWAQISGGWLVESSRPLTSDQIADARQRAADAGLSIEVKRENNAPARAMAIAIAAGALLALGILAMTVGLIRSESAGDLRTLTATGATARVRRQLTATTAGALALLGALLGVVGAYVLLLALYYDDLGYLSDVPILYLGLAVIGVPLAATAAGWLLAGREPPAIARTVIE